jgi:endonuclease/exonuclease/phosphatase family metal-dependent hydrolase
MRTPTSFLVGMLVAMSTVAAQAPARLKLMTYNILNYRNFTSYCTSSNNNPITKEAALREVIAYAQPDLLVCNEIGGATPSAHEKILTDVLNTGGTTRWASTSYANNGFSTLVNGVYYDQTKLGVKREGMVSKSVSNVDLVRVLDVVQFYYKDSLLSVNPDTVFFTVVAAHLKAGSAATDLADRATATAALMQHLTQRVSDPNVLMGGDFNIYKSQEAAFQNLVNHSVASERFYDPIGQLGTWANNANYAPYHTQSTRNANTNGGCFSGGGLDDRLDQWLVSSSVKDGLGKVAYVPGSFRIFGNDGMHFNQGIDEGTNYSVPANVRTALYTVSDHLPVMVELDIQRLGIGMSEYADAKEMWMRSRADDGSSILYWRGPVPLNIEVFDALGRKVQTLSVESNNQPLSPPSAASGPLFFRTASESRTLSTYTWVP